MTPEQEETWKILKDEIVSIVVKYNDVGNAVLKLGHRWKNLKQDQVSKEMCEAIQYYLDNNETDENLYVICRAWLCDFRLFLDPNLPVFDKIHHKISHLVLSDDVKNNKFVYPEWYENIKKDI